MVAIAASRGRARPLIVVINGAVALVVVALVAAVALVVRPPAPPGIAEFAPQAAKPISKAPPGLQSKFGAGAGCAGGQHCVGHGRSVAVHHAKASIGSAQTSGVPSALQCVTWPDGAVTQTFDPQSPPCVASWADAARGNGGATAPGVSSTTIRVALPEPSSASDYKSLLPLQNFFNSHYELYGRHLQLVPYNSQQDDAGFYVSEPTAQHADALQAAGQHVFAALDFTADNQGIQTLAAYADTLADRHVLTMSGGEAPPELTTSGMARRAPYEWTYEPTTSDLLANVGDLACRQLVGRDATYAPNYASKKRSFAIVLPENSYTGGQLPGVSELLSMLSGCGAGKVPVAYYNANNTNGGADGAFQESLVQFKSRGVTSLLFYPYWYPQNSNAPQVEATAISYQPEWVAMGWFYLVAAGLTTGSTVQVQHTFGVAEWNKLTQLGDEPWYQAYLAGGGSTDVAGTLTDADGVYRELQMLAAGIQMAGSRLTASSFASGMATTTFPNPGAATAPAYQATVGFSHNSHTMIDDYAGFWFSAQSSGAKSFQELETQSGNTWDQFCYVDRGSRWAGSTWPSHDGFKQGACR